MNHDSTCQKLYSGCCLHIPWEEKRRSRIWLWNATSPYWKRFCEKFWLLFVDIAAVQKSSGDVRLLNKIENLKNFINYNIIHLNVLKYFTAKRDSFLTKRPFCSTLYQKRQNMQENWKNMNARKMSRTMKVLNWMRWRSKRKSWDFLIQRKILWHQRSRKMVNMADDFSIAFCYL